MAPLESTGNKVDSHFEVFGKAWDVPELDLKRLSKTVGEALAS